ncbi:capsule assembly Wzi family protein [Marinoscillum pacificum]|uniref:capsule assembly Wzi family protein n=1 Tax=Marinoscillum pacificum TaxID=392723 RepID=UPI002157A02A|nr:capsule assembly Wzi family protein [Marinoscillum pacificum]
MRLNYIFSIAIISLSSVVFGQISAPGSLFTTIEITHDTTTLGFYQSVHSEEITNKIELLDPLFRTSANNYYPRGFNDGPVWKGKGLTIELHGGVAGKIGPVTYALYPVVYYSQNLESKLNPPILNNSISPYGYQFTQGLGGIDWPNRFGNSSFTTFHPGQSEIKLELGKFVTSVSTQNYSVGPSVFNPIILSRQGGGFPHLRIGSKPFDLNAKNLYLGKMELTVLAGFLKESEYFDNNEDNNRSYFNGLFFAYTPPFLENLTLGFNKALYKQTNRFSAQDLISVIHVLDTVGPNDQFDQLASATMEWKFPSVGFRAYMEFAYNDFGGFFKWIEPEHSRAYTIGFEKELYLKNGDKFLINYEHTNLSRNHTFLWRPEPSFYIHSVNKQGYTNQGQLLGAGIGPGSNCDILMVKFTHKQSTLGLSGSRIETNKDYLVRNIREPDHDIEYGWGGYVNYELEKLNIFFEIVRSRNHNKYYIKRVSNLYLSLGTQLKLN